MDLTIFRPYDIRGVYPAQLNEVLAYSVAQAYAQLVNPKTVALGCDIRLSSPGLFEAVKQGLVDHGVNVVDIGLVSTDMLYFAVANFGYDGGITVSASHNLKEFNGMKLVREKAIPIASSTGMEEIRNAVMLGYEYKSQTPGKVTKKDIVGDYIRKCLTFVDLAKIKPLKVVANAMSGPILTFVDKMKLPVTFIKLNEVPDGNFPKGQPDPSLQQNREETTKTILKEKADLGVAWDADADRFFVFDETGRFIPAYYLTIFLAQHFCKKTKGAKIVHDPRLRWGIEDKVKELGGQTVQNRSGHSFVKARMRTEDAVFGGESSGHYYFKDYYYCDNGLIPFLLMLQILSESGKKTSQLFDEYFEDYPISGEINTPVAEINQVQELLEKIEKHFASMEGAKMDKIDGVSVELADWRANIRGSNTEALIRVNVEARDLDALKRGAEEVLRFIG